ncbi:TM2 domain-containing protein [Lutimonas sp.]|uniref:TM2 domain-containing protein n=1 Tax=Lutimonas sp. TaxID=1872403 RepID=UPI003D9B0A3C
MEIVDEFGNKLPPQPENKRVLAGVLGILLGVFGVHKFVLGYQNEGLTMLLISILTCGIAAGFVALIGLIEGIVYLTKSDEEFYEMYQENKKPWF